MPGKVAKQLNFTQRTLGQDRLLEDVVDLLYSHVRFRLQVASRTNNTVRTFSITRLEGYGIAVCTLPKLA